MKDKKLLFLTLYTFGLTGGIENVCKAFGKALTEFLREGKIKTYQLLSMYDKGGNEKYIEKALFKGFGGRRILFSIQAILASQSSDIIVLSHVHLLIYARIIKKIFPKKRIILYAHGIEIWRNLSAANTKFIQNEIEIWAVSAYTANRIQALHQIEASKIQVLNNCLDPFFEIPKTFEKPASLLKKYNLPTNSKFILTLSRLSSTEQYKGYDQVLAVLNELDEDVHYILAGKADEKEQNRLQNLVQQNELQQRVIFTGYVPDAELMAHYQLADVMVMPSKAEGFGISFIEAMACGTQVIGGNQDGSVDALRQGAIGTLVNPTDLNEIKSAIETCLAKPDTEIDKRQLQDNCLAHFCFSTYKQKVGQLLELNA
ncbi:glycosyltransferase family 4 protein [Pedobacter rhizosphaerae]|uniref:Glycosyltransferase involved in cell wall bisynthesis n=1 Tax=Pedobacter rhizosphaerae TaxID=390241 RepID=A0A1H9N701_9SPHI|nr:glycosyltransferase family 4 protein [Pedobacter rhizosphaerae]SER31810.1 Glycosyltransferase involved in cell wall bisynthesis [Pedobacter rhizosphaerae]